MSAVVLDTHVVHWWSAEPERLSRAATRAIEGADDLVVAGVTWYELAWLADRGRITVSMPIRGWLDDLATGVVTEGITPAIAEAAVALPPTFPKDPADRLIYATAVVKGLRLITKDGRLRQHRRPTPVTIW